MSTRSMRVRSSQERTNCGSNMSGRTHWRLICALSGGQSLRWRAFAIGGIPKPDSEALSFQKVTKVLMVRTPLRCYVIALQKNVLWRMKANASGNAGFDVIVDDSACHRAIGYLDSPNVRANASVDAQNFVIAHIGIFNPPE